MSLQHFATTSTFTQISTIFQLQILKANAISLVHGSQVYNLWSCPQQEVQWWQVAKFLAWKLAIGENDFGR